MDMNDAVALEPGAPGLPVMVTDARYCIKCGYALQGLSVSGLCPECGTGVELSLREPTLASCDPAYLSTVRSGLSLVLNGILLQIVASLLGGLLGAFATAAGLPGMTYLVQIMNVGISMMLLVGYWKYTEPDPSQVMLEVSNSARSVIRVTVIIQAVFAAVQLMAALMAPGMVQSGVINPSPLGSAMVIVVVVIGLCSLVAWAVQFFSVMRYTRWLATRVPDHYVIRKTKTYMWLLPVLATVGVVIVIGPLLALILYWNLLDRMRKHFKSIVAGHGPAQLKGRISDVQPR